MKPVISVIPISTKLVLENRLDVIVDEKERKPQIAVTSFF